MSSNWMTFKSQFDKFKSHTTTCSTNPEKNDTENVTITDHTSWINKIGEAGNKPEDWLDYINLVKSHVNLQDSVERHNLLSCLFDRAFKAIPSSENKRNEAYAKLFLEYAQVKSQYSPDEAEALLTYARSIVRRFATVHIAAAEFEAKQGNVPKARKILEKAKLIEAEPKALIREALSNLDIGKTQLASSDSLKTACRDRNTGSTSSQDSTGEQLAANPAVQATGCLSAKVDNSSSDDTTNGNLTSETVSLAHLKSVLESAKKQPLRHYQSTPECRQLTKPGAESLPNWKRTMGKQIGLPMRVKKMSLPFSQKDQDGGDLEEEVDGVKPLPTQNETFTSHAHTSGYMSMSQSDVTASVEMSNGKQAVASCDFKEPMKYITPLASSTHHNIKLKSGSHVATPSFMDLSIAEKSSLDVPEKPMDCKKNLTPVIEAEKMESKEDSTCDIERMTVDSYKGADVKSVDPPVEDSREASGPPGLLPAPIIATSQPQPVSAAVGPVLSTPSMKGFQGQTIPMTPSMGPMETVTVNGHQYFIWKLVGRGGSAKVYQVFDTDKNTRALKCVDLEDATPTIINGFKNEIHLLRKLQYCKSVIKMYDFEHNEQLSKLFVVMEFGETDLATLFKSRTASGEGIKPQMIRYYWDEMLTAVQALHKEGVIHSDLKPANFMLVAGNLRLIDFGIANAVQQDKTSIFLNTPMGTLNYMSPEAIMESFDGGGDGGSVGDKVKPSYKISIRSDIWSLGCILYNMVHGKTPFQHIRNQLGKLQAITSPTHHIDFPDTGNKNLLDVLKKCLTRDPKSRPTTDQLLTHSYLLEDKKAASPATSSMSEAMMMNVLQEISRASPRSVQSISQELIQQLQKGKKIDLSNLPLHKKPETKSPPCAPTTDTSAPSVSHQNHPPPRVKHDSGGVVKKVRAPLQSINLHQK